MDFTESVDSENASAARAAAFDLGPWMFRWLRDELNKDDFTSICMAASRASESARNSGGNETTMELLTRAISAAEQVFGANDCSVALLYLDLSDCFKSQGELEVAESFESRGVAIFQNYIKNVERSIPGSGRGEPLFDFTYGNAGKV